MYRVPEISQLTLELIRILNHEGIKCSALSKGCLPIELADLNKDNEVGITLISLNEEFRKRFEPFAAPYEERIECLRRLSNRGVRTWVSIEPYPTPNILDQDFDVILESISFADRIVFGKLNYNPLVSKYPDNKRFYNDLSNRVIAFCEKNHIKYHIKKGTISEADCKIS